MRSTWASAFDLSLKTWLELLSATGKAFQSAAFSKDSERSGKHRKQTRDRTLLHQCRVATLASAANKTALNSLFLKIRLGMYVSSRLDARDGDRGSRSWVISRCRLDLEATKHRDRRGHA
jgi:hypothetical protein